MPVPELQVPVVGQWMTKITSLLRRLIKLRESAPDEKSLVFTQFPDALELVARALRINGFYAAQLSTRQKVRHTLGLSKVIVWCFQDGQLASQMLIPIQRRL